MTDEVKVEQERCGESGALCVACSLPAHELTQEPGCGGPLTALDRAKARAARRAASGEMHIEGSIYEGMGAYLVRGGRTVAHVVSYSDAVDIAAALAARPAPAEDAVEKLRALSSKARGRSMRRCAATMRFAKKATMPIAVYVTRTAAPMQSSSLRV